MKLVERGYNCVLIEREGLGARQSGHSHGYIHRGYIYLLEADLAQELRDAREKWEEFLSGPSAVSPFTTGSLIGFENAELATFAAETWRSAGLPVVPLDRAEWPSCLQTSPLTCVFATDEQSFDVTKVLENCRHRLQGSELIGGVVCD